MTHTLRTRRTLLTAIAALPVLSSLSGCGFHLRGHFQAPFDTLYLQMRENTPFSSALKRMVESGSNVRVVDHPNEADAILELLSIRRDREVLSVSDAGRAREYELTLTLEFRVKSPDDFDYVDPTTLLAHRDLTYSESEFLSREKEEELLYRDMENDLMAQIVRYIEAAHRP